MLDIIIVNYNSTAYLLACLASIESALNGLKATIYVQDNASTDAIELVAERFPYVVLERKTCNVGFARAVNDALKISTSPFIMLLNPDTIVAADFFELSLKYMHQNPQVGILGPRILDFDGTLQNSARSFPTPLTAFFGRSSLLSRFFPNNPITCRNLLSLRSDGYTPMEVDWLSGACMLIRRRAVDQVGYLDERFFMYWEDTDWCRRMSAGGWKIVYFPRTNIFHHVGKSSETNAYRSAIEFHKSVYRLFKKYAPPLMRCGGTLVFAGIILRLLLVLGSHAFSQLFGSLKAQRGGEQPASLRGKQKRIKVLRVIARLNIGGPTIHVHLLTRGLNPVRFTSRLVSGRIAEQEGDMGYLFKQTSDQQIMIPELQREISPILDVMALIHIFMILIREKPDIVHTHTAKAGSSARIAVLIYNLMFCKRVRTVHTFHGHVFRGYFSPLRARLFVWVERLLAGITHSIIAISDSQKKELVEIYRIAPARKFHTIPLGFELTPFLNCKQSAGRLRRQAAIEPHTVTIGIIGRLVPIKQHDLFLQGARQLLDITGRTDLKFLIIGDGEMRGILEKKCRDLKLSDQVIFCGWIKNMPAVYADLDVLALTSLNEGTPVSIIEAMAAVVPVVAANVGGVPDLLGDVWRQPDYPAGFSIRQRGIMYERNDAMAFAEGLSYLLTHDPIRRICVQRARAFVVGNYSHRRLIADIEALYNRLAPD